MVFLFSDGLLAQTLKTACVRSAHILLVEFKFHMGYGLLRYAELGGGAAETVGLGDFDE